MVEGAYISDIEDACDALSASLLLDEATIGALSTSAGMGAVLMILEDVKRSQRHRELEIEGMRCFLL